jgi:hypothetical protein
VVVAAAPFRTSDGLQVLPDQDGAKPDVVVDLPQSRSAHGLDAALAEIKARYGEATASFVRTQLEHRGHIG